VYLKVCIAGDPGCVVAFDKRGRCLVEWFDLDLGRWTSHDPENLVLDEAFTSSQRMFDFESVAA